MSNVRRFMHLKRRHSCTGKKKYRTAKEARQIAASMTKSQGVVVLSYRCVYCGGHHCGHPPARVTLPSQGVAS